MARRAAALERLLARGLAEMGMTVAREVQSSMLDHLALVAKWNRAQNLTGFRDPEQMVVHLLLDSLVLIPYVRGRRVADVGSGAGFPGVPLALTGPDRQVTLIERRDKRAQFLIHANAVLGLGCEIVSRDASAYRPTVKFDTLVARAFGSLSGLLTSAGHLCRPGGRVVVPKGAHPDSELAQVPRSAYTKASIEPVSVPGVHAPRHVIVLELPDSQANNG